MSTYYRSGNRNARNIYRVTDGAEEHIGCAFTEDDGRLIVAALNAYDPALVLGPPPGPGNLFGADAHGQPGFGQFPDSCGWPREQCIGHAARPTSTCEGCNRARRGAIWACPMHGDLPADSCTCTKAGPDPACAARLGMTRNAVDRAVQRAVAAGDLEPDRRAS